MTDKAAARRWEKARFSYEYFRKHIKSKSSPTELSLLDLLFVSNFKGGSATIAEPIATLDKKLVEYSEVLAELVDRYGNVQLKDVDEPELDELVSDGEAFLQMTLNAKLRISGFGPSYASALLNAYLPNVFPILDRRGLNGAEIPSIEANSQGQVKRIERHFGPLIRYYWSWAQENPDRSLENLDQELFVMPLSGVFRPAGS